MIRVLCAAAIAVSVSVAPVMGEVRITERTKHYTIKGKTAGDFARSMSARGPYSRSKRTRAWATAGRKLDFQIINRKIGNRCGVRDVKVSMRITTTLPRLRSIRGIGKRQATRWKRMSNLLVRHENVHVANYRALAQQTYRSLKKLKPAASCRALDRAALRVVENLSRKDTAKNRRFDETDRRNYRRMTRLYAGS